MTGFRTGALALAVLLAGCGGQSQPTGPAAASPSSPSSPTGPSNPTSPAPAPSGGRPAPGFASTSAGSRRDVISKPDFLIDANAVCSAADARRRALPEPTGATDYDAIVANLTGILRIRPDLLTRAEALVVRAGERAELERRWLDVERADFAAFEPAARRLVDAARAHDPDRTAAASADLSAVPDHDSAVAAYLTGFGLADCARLYTD